MVKLEEIDWASGKSIHAYQEALEEALERFFEGVGGSFLQGVFEDAVGALSSATLVASARKVSDPFAYTNVMRRWYGALRSLTALRDTPLGELGVSQEAVERVLEQSNLPLRAYEDVALILGESREQEWTDYRTKRALSRLLIPKMTSGRWDSRAKYRAHVSSLARTVATETLGVQSQEGIARRGLAYKTWLSHKDDRVRHTHLAANGQTVPVGGTFTVGLSQLRYPGDPLAPLGEKINCRCTMKGTNKMPKSSLIASARRDTPAQAPATTSSHPPVQASPSTASPSEGHDEGRGLELGVWQGVLALEGAVTGDGRLISPEALTWDTLPIPLRMVTSDVGAHDGAVVVGAIQTITRTPRDGVEGVWNLEATGTFDLDSEQGREAYRLVKDGLMPGVSVDLDNMSFEVRVRREIADLWESGGEASDTPRNPDGSKTVREHSPEDEIHIITSARLRAATLVSIPAFERARLEVLEVEQEDEDDLEEIDSDLTDTVDYADQEESFNWVSQVGGLPGYIRKIADALMRKGMGESRAIATAVQQVKRWAQGGGRVSPATRAKAVKALAEWEAKKARAKAHSATYLTASGAAPVAPPNAWFRDPQLTEPTALTVTEEGQVFGHLATWDTCHIGQADYCVTPPSSVTGYAYFHTGAVITAENHEVAVGHIVLGTTHASGEKGVTATMSHYDNTGLAVADVRAGEDSHGIWVAGALRPGVAQEDVRTLRSSPLSGDWRRVQGNLELVSALAVNLPGFPIPRPQGRTQNGDMYSLVASGMLTPGTATQTRIPSTLSAEDVTELRGLLRKERASKVSRMATQLREAQRAKIDRVAQKLNGESYGL